MLITKGEITFEVDPGAQEAFWNSVNRNEWEADTYEIFKKFLSKDHSYVDVGAWIGPTVLYGSQLSKKCYCFEPDLIAVGQLYANLALNPKIDNVNVLPFALDSRTGVTKFGNNNNTFGDSMSSMIWQNGAHDVATVSVHDFFAQFEVEDCNFMKIDIEGGEYFLAPGLKDYLKSLKVKPTIYLSMHAPWFNDTHAFYAKMIDLLSIYENIYDSKGNRINSITDIYQLEGFASLVASDYKW